MHTKRVHGLSSAARVLHQRVERVHGNCKATDGVLAAAHDLLRRGLLTSRKIKQSLLRRYSLRVARRPEPRQFPNKAHCAPVYPYVACPGAFRRFDGCVRRSAIAVWAQPHDASCLQRKS